MSTITKNISKEDMQKRLEELERGMINTIASGKWKDILDFQSKLYRHSFLNSFMAMVQADIMGIEVKGMFKGAKQWMKDFKRTVKEDEVQRPIQMLAPKIIKYSNKQRFSADTLNKNDFIITKGKIASKIFENKNQNYGIYSFQIEEVNGINKSGYIKVKGNILNNVKINTYYKLEGKIALYKSGRYWERQIEVEEITEINYQTSYNLRSKPKGFMYVDLYDINQTEGESLPIDNYCKELEGDSENAELVYNSLVNILDIPVDLEPIKKGNGYFTNNPDDLRIAVKESLGMNHRCKTLIHESAHYQMYLKKNNGLDLSKFTKGRDIYKELYAIEEVIVESVAYIVAKHYGFDTSEYSFEYITGWAKADPTNIKKVGTLIQETSKEIIEEINKYIEKENQTHEEVA